MPVRLNVELQELQERSLKRLTRILNPQRGFVSVIVPVARQNDVLNPSFETGTTNWAGQGGATLARTTAWSYHGAYGLQITPSAGTNSDGALYGSATLLTYAATTAYAVSCKFYCPVAGGRYRLAVYDGSGNELTGLTFTATGRAQWVSLIHFEAAGGTRRIYITKAASAVSAAFFVDGVQSEACAPGQVFASTYLDGDQAGLVAGQFPAPYQWLGTPHASASTRSAGTRAGGQVINLDQLGLQLMAFVGLGLAPIIPIATDYASLDGARYQTSRLDTRPFQLEGLVSTASLAQLGRQRAALMAALTRDATPIPQPCVLVYQPYDCLDPIGDAAQIAAVYTGGLEGDTSSQIREKITLQFTQYIPQIIVQEAGAALTGQASIASTNILRRTPGGAWGSVGGAMSGGSAAVYAVAVGPDGRIYAGGNFTTAGGVAASNIAVWNGSAWAALGAGVDSTVFALAFAPDGRLYAAGLFTNAGGGAANRIAVWNGSAWAALGTGLNAQAFALLVGLDGQIYVGGQFTTAGGGAANLIAAWNGSAWSAVAGLTGSLVESLALGLDGRIYASGGLTVPTGNIAVWNGSSWSALGSGTNSIVTALAVGPDGRIYAGGQFTTAGGISASRIAVWNGSSWAALGSGVTGNTLGSTLIEALAFDGAGALIAAGDFTAAGGVALPDPLARWNGSTWQPYELDISGSVYIRCLLQTGDATLYIGTSTPGTAITAALTTVTNRSTTRSYPRLTIAAGATAVRVYQIVNSTTGKGIATTLTIQPGDTAYLDTTPANPSFRTTAQGSVLGRILPGAALTDLALQPGVNVLSVFVSTSDATITMLWPITVQGVDELTWQ